MPGRISSRWRASAGRCGSRRALRMSSTSSCTRSRAGRRTTDSTRPKCSSTASRSTCPRASPRREAAARGRRTAGRPPGRRRRRCRSGGRCRRRRGRARATARSRAGPRAQGASRRRARSHRGESPCRAAAGSRSNRPRTRRLTPAAAPRACVLPSFLECHPPVRRFVRVLVCAALLALALAGAALAGNGGLAPVAPASPNEGGIRSVYWLITGFTGFIFLLVEVALVVFIVRYRSRGRGREVEGPQVIGHTNLELAWTAGPVVILAVIAAFVFYKVGGIRNAPAATGGSQTIRIEGHQFYWEFVYPDGAISINTLRLPLNRKTELEIISADVAHSWWVPSLGGKLDAIPGQTNRESFRPAKLGTFRGQCAEFCGIQHAAMITYVKVMPPDEYDAWVQRRLQSPSEVGRETFQGVCATCHGLSGQGDIGPAIAQSPLLSDRNAMTLLLRNGRNKMPAVGKTWNDAQLKALLGYLKKRVGGGQGPAPARPAHPRPGPPLELA